MHSLSSRAPECYPRGGCSTAGFLLAATICCCWLHIQCPVPAPQQPARTLRLAYSNRQASTERVCTHWAPHPTLNPTSTFAGCISPSVLVRGTQSSSHCHSSPPEPFCLLPTSTHTPLLCVMRGWQVFFFFLLFLFKWIHIGLLQSSLGKLSGHCILKAS